jgi:hypothetical protein
MPVTVALPINTLDPTAIVVVAAAVPKSVAEVSLLGFGSKIGGSETAAAAREMAIVDVRGADASEVKGGGEAAARIGGRTKPRRMEQVRGSSPFEIIRRV